jgi:hypothetical protein
MEMALIVPKNNTATGCATVKAATFSGGSQSRKMRSDFNGDFCAPNRFSCGC